MSIKVFSTYIRRIITKANRKEQTTLSAEEIIAKMKEIILKAINNKSPNQKVNGRIKIQMAVIPKRGSKWSGDPEEENACRALGLTKQASLAMEEFDSSTDNDPFGRHCDVLILSRSSFISMMMSWINLCLGNQFSYQVSLSDKQYRQVVEEFQESYRFIPEQAAVSPRGGAIVRELAYSKFKVLLYIICLTELGPREDLMLASEAMERMTKEVRRTLSRFRLEGTDTYPDVESALLAE